MPLEFLAKATMSRTELMGPGSLNWLQSKEHCLVNQLYFNNKEGRKGGREGRKKKGRREGRKEGRK